MARLMRMAEESSGWAGDNGGSGRWGSARRNWTSMAWLVAGTIAVAVTSYSLSLKVASERREMEKVARQNISLEGELKALDAELRVRMRMPQLQRWNDGVLGLVPISATQYLDSPVRLTSYGKALESDLPRAQLAVRDVMPAPAAAAQPRLVSAEVAPRAEMSRVEAPHAVVRTSSPTPAPASGMARPAPEAPADLLRQVEMTFSTPAGPNP